jgi:hypothetical protein
MTNRLFEYFKSRFFKRVEETTVQEPTEEELVEKCAFKFKHYPLKYPLAVMSGDMIRASITEGGETIAQIEEPMNITMTVNTISVVRFNDALGYKNAVGAVFGER